MIKDSGNRKEFDTGAVRDISEGKGRADLLPLDVVAELLNAPCLKSIEKFKRTKDISLLLNAIQTFVTDYTDYKDICTAMIEVSKHFEEGAKKYGENNWKKGIPLHCYVDSAVRHFFKHLRGDTDEPHDRAFIWNLLCVIWTYNHKQELDDIEQDISENKTLQINNEMTMLYLNFLFSRANFLD